MFLPQDSNDENYFKHINDCLWSIARASTNLICPHYIFIIKCVWCSIQFLFKWSIYCTIGNIRLYSTEYYYFKRKISKCLSYVSLWRVLIAITMSSSRNIGYRENYIANYKIFIVIFRKKYGDEWSRCKLGLNQSLSMETLAR